MALDYLSIPGIFSLFIINVNYSLIYTFCSHIYPRQTNIQPGLASTFTQYAVIYLVTCVNL